MSPRVVQLGRCWPCYLEIMSLYRDDPTGIMDGCLNGKTTAAGLAQVSAVQVPVPKPDILGKVVSERAQIRGKNLCQIKPADDAA